MQRDEVMAPGHIGCLEIDLSIGSSRSDEMTVAVDFSPRFIAKNQRRGATLESFVKPT